MIFPTACSFIVAIEYYMSVSLLLSVNSFAIISKDSLKESIRGVKVGDTVVLHSNWV